MSTRRTWQEQLDVVVRLMKDLSSQTDPQEAAKMYGSRLRSDKLMMGDRWFSLSRRNLTAPFYRITRSSTWKQNIDPWKQPQLLPQYDSGLMGELIYGNEPVVINNLPERVCDDDPAREYFLGMNQLIAMPQYDGGQALNMTVTLMKEPTFDLEALPNLIWQANLWGRAVHNLMLRRQLEDAQGQMIAANQALDSELRSVGQVQRMLLPADLPYIPGLEIAANYETSKRAGGDYYDVFDCGNGRWVILMADVSGHGAPAAVVMAVTHAIAHLHPDRGHPPSELLAFVNRTLARRYTSANGTFVTACCLMYDANNGTISYSSAGHPPSRLRRGDHVIALRGEPGLPLGLDEDEVYPQTTIGLEHRDAVVIYTDGITEARSPQRELFGDERLDRSILNCSCGPKQIIESLVADVNKFSEGARPDDDQTLVVLRYTGK